MITTFTRPAGADDRAPGLLSSFALLVAIEPIHMAEQLVFGLDILHELKAAMAVYYSQFESADVATVVLVIAAVVLVQALVLACLAGGRARLVAAAMFAAMGVGEAHHLIQAAFHGGYFPGVVTAIVYAYIGVLVFRAIRREWHSLAQRSASLATAA